MEMNNTLHPLDTANSIPVADYISQYNSADKIFSHELSALKNNAIKSFETLGFPTTKNEEWKYTNLAGLFKNKFLISLLSLSQRKKISPLISPCLRIMQLIASNH